MKIKVCLFALVLASTQLATARISTVGCAPFIKTSQVDCILEEGDIPSEEKFCETLKFDSQSYSVSQKEKVAVTAAMWKKKINQVVGVCIVKGEVVEVRLK